MCRLATLTSLFVLSLTVHAAEADKRAYTLTNPTPPALLRELSTDRPDATESPFTVDAGHAQVEMDFATVTRDRQGGVRTTELAVAPFNVRLGLLHNVEAGLFLDPYVRATEQPRVGAKTRVRGVGDTTLRLKYNFWGNDGGETAFGLIADVKLPTAARGLGNDKVEGALTLPIAVKLGAGWEMGAMTTLATAYDGSRYRPVWANTVTVAHDLFEHVGAFWEITSQAGDGPHVCTFDTGIAWQINRDLQLDGGANIGVSRSAPDVTWFAGVSRRF
jgi:hypothetical protein